ncbi:hypothetical protein PV779_41745 [Streptomyces sp. ID01-9D]|nr:hypothetical protein [Streptomyces sp. ID01-9D]
MNYRSTAAVNRGAHRAAPSSVRNDGDRLTGDPPSGEDGQVGDRSLHLWAGHIGVRPVVTQG